MESAIAEKEGGASFYGVNFYAVPEGCIAAIIAFTTPTDACRLAVVSKVFRSASDSDVVWEQFIPSDCDVIVARSDGGEALLAEFQTKKQLYMRLADRPILLDGSTKSFWLDKSCGKNCWMIAARTLTIIWGDTPRYWKWTSVPESRFPEVAELLEVCWLEIRGMIKTSMLSPETHYAAYLVFQVTEDASGLGNLSEASVRSGEGKSQTQTRLVHLIAESTQFQVHRIPPRGFRGFNRLRLPSFNYNRGPRLDDDQYPKPRSDGWQELKIGEFFTHLEVEDEVDLSVLEVKAGNWKGGLIVEGIEVRPVGPKQ